MYVSYFSGKHTKISFLKNTKSHLARGRKDHCRFLEREILRTDQNKYGKCLYINAWLHGTLILLAVALVCWRMRNKSEHMGWMNLATHMACLVWSRTLNCGNTLNLQDFYCSAKVGRKRRTHISKSKRTIRCLVTGDGGSGIGGGGGGKNVFLSRYQRYEGQGKKGELLKRNIFFPRGDAPSITGGDSWHKPGYRPLRDRHSST